MNEHPGERYYYEQYMTVLAEHLDGRPRVLDVGCQYGRFALPLAAHGHQVVATDIDQACLDYVRAQNPSIEVRCESADESARDGSRDFDVVLCLEVLYLLPDWRSVVAGLVRRAAPTGVVACSHRSQGYYIHRFLRERRYDELDQLLAGRHPAINAQSSAELHSAYRDAGVDVVSVTPIGTFSGIEVDPFAAINDPTVLTTTDRERLAGYELDPELTAQFMDSARYLLVVGTPS